MVLPDFVISSYTFPVFVLWDVIVFKRFPAQKFEPVPSQFQTLGIGKSESASKAVAFAEQMLVPG
jgi:hypothetical protein